MVGFEQQHDLALPARHPIDRCERRRHQSKRSRSLVDAQQQVAADAFGICVPFGLGQNTVCIAIDHGENVPHDVDAGRETKLHRETFALEPIVVA